MELQQAAGMLWRDPHATKHASRGGTHTRCTAFHQPPHAHHSPDRACLATPRLARPAACSSKRGPQRRGPQVKASAGTAAPPDRAPPPPQMPGALPIVVSQRPGPAGRRALPSL
jgi:hypothetical protein